MSASSRYTTSGYVICDRPRILSQKSIVFLVGDRSQQRITQP
ncbi:MULTISPECIES: hypothetical protein [unclassified Anabaena]